MPTFYFDTKQDRKNMKVSYAFVYVVNRKSIKDMGHMESMDAVLKYHADWFNEKDHFSTKNKLTIHGMSAAQGAKFMKMIKPEMAKHINIAKTSEKTNRYMEAVKKMLSDKPSDKPAASKSPRKKASKDVAKISAKKTNIKKASSVKSPRKSPSKSPRKSPSRRTIKKVSKPLAKRIASKSPRKSPSKKTSVKKTSKK